MKKTIALITGLLLSAAGFTACNYEQELPPVAYPEGGSEETIHSGAWNDPYSIWQVHAGVEADRAWVCGYIVGYINTFDGDYSKLREKSAVFSASGAPNSNLLMANTPDETNWENCIPVQLEYGTSGRDLSLQQHPEYLGRQVSVYGLTGDKYLSVYGVRFCSAYNWGDKGKPGEGEPDQSGSLTFLTSGLGDFTVDNVLMPEGGTYVWTWDSRGYAKASAYISSQNRDAEAYLISPAITLAASQSIAKISHTANYLNNNPRADFMEVCAREAGAAQWTVVGVSEWPAGNNWDFVEAEIDLAAFAGKTIQIGFHYKSTTKCSPTWEVKNLVIPGTSL